MGPALGGSIDAAAGDLIVVRYADDIVMGFENRDEAERFLQEWKGPPAKDSDWSYIRTRRA